MMKITASLGYLLIILGSIGLIVFALKIRPASRRQDLDSIEEGAAGFPAGYQFLKYSWVLLIFGMVFQLIDYLAF